MLLLGTNKFGELTALDYHETGDVDLVAVRILSTVFRSRQAPLLVFGQENQGDLFESKAPDLFHTYIAKARAFEHQGLVLSFDELSIQLTGAPEDPSMVGRKSRQRLDNILIRTDGAWPRNFRPPAADDSNQPAGEDLEAAITGENPDRGFATLRQLERTSFTYALKDPQRFIAHEPTLLTETLNPHSAWYDISSIQIVAGALERGPVVVQQAGTDLPLLGFAMTFEVNLYGARLGLGKAFHVIEVPHFPAYEKPVRPWDWRDRVQRIMPMDVLAAA